jgi:hypothetical protein
VSSHGEHAGTLAGFLPGPVPDRTVWQGWNRWRRTRDDFVPAPRLSRAEYQRLGPRARRLHDLHRLATHASLPIQDTPMSQAVSWLLRARIEDGALSHKPGTRTGVMVNGGGFQGKTETVCAVAAQFEDDWLELNHQLNPDAVPGTRDLIAPVAYVRTPVKATPISACQRILDFYGEDHKGMRQDELTRTVKTAIFEHATRALILDDITRLKLHREADQDVLDLIRELMSLPVTLILVGVGIPQSGLLRQGRKDAATRQWVFPPVTDRGRSPNDEAATQTERRFDLVDLDPFRYDTPGQIAAWTAHLVGLETHLRLLNATEGMLSGDGMPEYLYRRASGIVGILEKIIQTGCRHAIQTGEERLTTALLDRCTLSPADLEGRDPDAGEIPGIPAPRAPARPGDDPAAKPRRSRNTVFDDRGTPQAAAR